MLKKCPLCGNDASENIEFYAFVMKMSIQCTKCGCMIEEDLSTEKEYTSANKIIDFMNKVEGVWNNRIE